MEIGAYAAKTHLPKLLSRVQRGESIIITRRGKAVAELRPIGNKPDRAEIEALFARMDAYRAARARRTNPITAAEIIAAKNAGRR